jgi:nitroreductase
MATLLEIIKGRRSVRTFDGRPLRPEDREKLAAFIPGVTNPFGVPVELVLLDAEEHGLSSPVITGEKMYATGRVPKVPYADVAFGFSFEKLVLYAWSLGIGTTWMGGTMKRDTFARAVGLKDGERIPCVSPLGYPAAKMSVRETVMRKDCGADSRMPAEKIFFEGNLETPLAGAKKEALGDLIEMVRWAPSAINRQPWRVIVTDAGVHFYEKKDKGYVSDAVGDMQKIDIGIALCHFVMGLEEQGKTPSVTVSDPGIAVSDNIVYIATVQA